MPAGTVFGREREALEREIFRYLGLRGTEAGKGAVMASVEPVVASLMGFIAFQEAPTPLGILGILLVLGAVILLNLEGPAQETTEKDAS